MPTSSASASPFRRPMESPFKRARLATATTAAAGVAMVPPGSPIRGSLLSSLSPSKRLLSSPLRHHTITNGNGNGSGNGDLLTRLQRIYTADGVERVFCASSSLFVALLIHGLYALGLSRPFDQYHHSHHRHQHQPQRHWYPQQHHQYQRQ
jgi:hypothetical protein